MKRRMPEDRPPGRRRTRRQRGRRLPFYRWKAPEGSTGTTYAVRPSVAAVFLAAQLGAA
ncbi:DUF6416 domain-containing protein [Streptomyces sp. NPDC015220]|uniref:DUF6416 domain-containing protein n=1 Tax=Streptomyces sp. NPDC015220 TaxID=3364947 RepID=UPI0036FF26BA